MRVGIVRCLAIILFSSLLGLPAVAQDARNLALPQGSNAAPQEKQEVSGTSTCEKLTESQRADLDRTLNDWPFLTKYREANVQLGAPRSGEDRVVFMGDSITEGWGKPESSPPSGGNGFFPGKPYVNRGISGQTTPQMLVRFRQDVIQLKPRVVVILAGTNDIAENTGRTTLAEIEANLQSMSELARANGIAVALCSVLPVIDYPWRRGLSPAPKIAALNVWIKEYATRNRLTYVDYYSATVDSLGGLRKELSEDGVHPNELGYKTMAPLAEAGIAEALKNQPHSAAKP